MINENLNFLSIHEFTGKWWIPGKRKQMNFGKLICSQEKIELEIQGPKWKENEEQIIFGISSKNELITLFGCIVPMRIQFNDWSNKKISVSRVAVGYLCRRENQETTKSLSIVYENLNYWIGIPNFIVTDPSDHFYNLYSFKSILKSIFPKKFKKDLFPDYSIKYSKPWKSLKTIYTDNKISIKIGYLTSSPDYQPFDMEAKITELPFVKIESKSNWTFENYSKTLWMFQNFLTIMLNKPTKVLYLKSYLNKKNEYGEYISANQYYRLSSPSNKNTLSWIDSKYNYKRLGEKRTHEIIGKWFENYSNIEDILDLFFYNENQSFTYLQHKFLNLVQALESFHRYNRNNLISNNLLHQKRIEEILNSVPLEHKEWLNRKLAHSNEPTLRDRIEELYSDFNFILDRILSSKRKRKYVLSKICATRNYLTHFDSSTKIHSAKLLELYPLSEFITFWLKLCLLKSLGFNKDEIESIVNENSKLRSYLTLKFKK